MDSCRLGPVDLGTCSGTLRKPAGLATAAGQGFGGREGGVGDELSERVPEGVGDVTWSLFFSPFFLGVGGVGGKQFEPGCLRKHGGGGGRKTVRWFQLGP